MMAPTQAIPQPATTLGSTRRLEAVLLEPAVLVDPFGVPYDDAEPSLLAAHEAGLRLVLSSVLDRPGARDVVADVPVPLEKLPAQVDGALRAALERAGLRAGTTLHVAADPHRLRDTAVAGLRTAWVNRCGLTAPAPPDHEWRNLLGLVALCRATPALVRSQPRC
jgi:hypothetical protein